MESRLLITFMRAICPAYTILHLAAKILIIMILISSPHKCTPVLLQNIF